jgi:hypothetical protein
MLIYTRYSDDSIVHHSPSLHLSLVRTRSPAVLRAVSISLGSIIPINDNQILRTVIVLSTEVRLENRLGTLSISLLRIKRGTRHVRNHGITTTEWVFGVSERVVLWCWLWEPDITTVTTEVAGLEGICDILLDDNGTTSSVDEP